MKVEIIDGDNSSQRSGLEPNTTQVPNIVIDWLMADLNGAEFKVLMFFVRQKYGFDDRRRSDNVQFEFNISEIQNGITFKLKVPNEGRNYKRVCAGTGLSRDAVASAIHSLSKMDFIDITRKGSRKIPHKIRVGKVTDIQVSRDQIMLTDESFEKLYGRKNQPKDPMLEEKTVQNTDSIGGKNLPKGDVLAGKTFLLKNKALKTKEDICTKEKKSPIHIQIVIDAYQSENNNKPTVSVGHAIFLGKLWAEYGEEKYTNTIRAWSVQKQKDGTPHPIGFLCHDPDQYYQKSRSSSQMTNRELAEKLHAALEKGELKP